MSLPSGVTAATLTAKVTKTNPSSSPISTSVSIAPSVDLIHKDSGVKLSAMIETLVSGPNPSKMAVPHSSQAGFVNDSGRAVATWHYVATTTSITREGSVAYAPLTKLFLLPAGITEADLETLSPYTPWPAGDADGAGKVLVLQPGETVPDGTASGTVIVRPTYVPTNLFPNPDMSQAVDGDLVGLHTEGGTLTQETLDGSTVAALSPAGDWGYQLMMLGEDGAGSLTTEFGLVPGREYLVSFDMRSGAVVPTLQMEDGIPEVAWTATIGDNENGRKSFWSLPHLTAPNQTIRVHTPMMSQYGWVSDGTTQRALGFIEVYSDLSSAPIYFDNFSITETILRGQVILGEEVTYDGIELGLEPGTTRMLWIVSNGGPGTYAVNVDGVPLDLAAQPGHGAEGGFYEIAIPADATTVSIAVDPIEDNSWNLTVTDFLPPTFTPGPGITVFDGTVEIPVITP